jgi:hypothetical protein
VFFDEIADYNDDDEDTVNVQRIHVYFNSNSNTNTNSNSEWLQGWASLTGRTIEDHDPIISIIKPYISNTNTSTNTYTNTSTSTNANANTNANTNTNTSTCQYCDGPCDNDDTHCIKCYNFINSQ